MARVKAAGLSDRIQLLFCDYREGHGLGLFDKVCQASSPTGNVNLECTASVGSKICCRPCMLKLKMGRLCG